MSRAFSDLIPSAGREFPAVNVWADGDAATAMMEVPGIDPKAVDISVAGKTATVRGFREPEKLQEGESYHRSERRYGSFSRTVPLPREVEQDKAAASFKKGVLTISLPKTAQSLKEARKIDVKSG